MKTFVIKPSRDEAHVLMWVRVDINTWWVVCKDGSWKIQPITWESGYTHEWEPSLDVFDVFESAK